MNAFSSSDRSRASDRLSERSSGARRAGPKQRTLGGPVQCSGIGLHSGAPSVLTLHPAPANHGVQFRRTDVAGVDAVIPAIWSNVSSTQHCTTLGNAAGVQISTVEHLMAALAGCGVDNVMVSVDGPELPIMDGSSAPFVFLIECAGIVEQSAPRRAIRILKPVMVSERGRSAALSPSSANAGDSLTVSFEIDFAGSQLARQEGFFQVTTGSFKSELARARTFGFIEEVDGLRAAGLALGGSLDNAVVVAGEQVLNEDGLRFDNEFVRHKVLDCVGDLALAGASVLGHYHGVRAGHRLTNKLLHALFETPDAWELIDYPGLRVVESDRAPILEDVADAVPAYAVA